MASLLTSDEKSAVAAHLLRGCYDQMKADKEELKAKAKAKKLEEIQEQKKVLVAKSTIFSIESKFSRWANEAAIETLKGWKAEQELRKTIKNPDELEQCIKTNNAATIEAMWGKIWSHEADFKKYADAKNIVSNNKECTVDIVAKTIYTLAEDRFNKLKKVEQLLFKTIQIKTLDSFNTIESQTQMTVKMAKMRAKIAEIPMTIEDKVQEIRDKLDKILGKYLEKNINPNMSEFDIDVILAKLDAIVSPLISVMSPLESVGGSIPIIGDLAAIFTMMSSASGGKKLSKEEIKKIIGDKKPEIPEGMMDNIEAAMMDVYEVAIKLPMCLINVIFQMINVIYSKLKIITSIIPLGDLFPLTLIDTAIEAGPKIWDFQSKGAALFKAALMGLVKDKLAEAMALSLPGPSNMSLPLIPQIEIVKSEKPSAQSTPDKPKKTYAQINTEFVKAHKEGKHPVTMIDAGRVLKNYKKIYDGSNKSINVYTPLLNILKTDEKGNQYYEHDVTKSSIVRYQGTPEDYESYLNKTFCGDHLLYEEYNKTESVTGADEYAIVGDQIKKKEPNIDLVINTKLEL